jgi:dTDP-4-amino-4,6-dideoxygalactose transaminase
MNRVPFLDLKPIGHLAGLLNVSFDRVFNSGTYIGGKEVEAFEKEWSEYCDAKYCVGVGNGYDALMLACKFYSQSMDRMGFIYNNQVLVPWKTCLPTWTAVYNGGFDPEPSVISDKLTIAVHIYGQIVLPHEARNKSPMIEDCAQAHGAKLNGVMAGKFGRVASWSFYPTKCLGALGDAGAITTDDEEIANFVRSMRNYGNPENSGINSRLDPLQAAFLRVKLPYLDKWNNYRRENALTYKETIVPNKIVLPKSTALWDEPNYHIFAIETDNRDDLRRFLLDNNVETMIHYPQVPYPSTWKIPEAEEWTKRTLSLPVAPHVTPYICKQIAVLINQWQGI